MSGGGGATRPRARAALRSLGAAFAVVAAGVVFAAREARAGGDEEPVASCVPAGGCPAERFVGATAVGARVYFKASCAKREVCYATLGRTQSECDDAYLDEMSQDCRGSFPNRTQDSAERTKYDECVRFADAQYKAAPKDARPAYAASQSCAARAVAGELRDDANAVAQKAPAVARASATAELDDIRKVMAQVGRVLDDVDAMIAWLQQVAALAPPSSSWPGDQLKEYARTGVGVDPDYRKALRARAKVLAAAVAAAGDAAAQRSATEKSRAVVALANAARAAVDAAAPNDPAAFARNLGGVRKKNEAAHDALRGLDTAVRADVAKAAGVAGARGNLVTNPAAAGLGDLASMVDGEKQRVGASHRRARDLVTKRQPR